MQGNDGNNGGNGNNNHDNSFSKIPNAFSSPNSENDKIANKLKFCLLPLFSLAFMRIFAFQFFWMMNDLLAALIVFCTYSSRGKLMAIFCLITGIMGVIYELTITSNMSGANKNAGVGNNSTITMNTMNTMNAVGNYSHNNDQNDEMGMNFDRTYDYANANGSGGNFLNIMITFNMILAVLVYSAIIYYSYKGIQKFESGDDENRNLNQNQRDQRDQRDYGTIDERRGGYVPFSGRGTTIG